MFYLRKYLLPFVLCLFLNACGFMPSKTSSDNLHYMGWQQRQSELNTVKNWDMHGSIGITYKGKTDIASFEWRNIGENYAIDIHSPMNLVSLHIVGSPGKVTLWKSGKQYETASTIEELMHNQLGWELPIANLSYWIRALPSPSLPINFKKHDGYNHLVKLQQTTWSIEYLSFFSTNEIDLPSKMIMQSSDMRCKIVVKRWGLI